MNIQKYDVIIGDFNPKKGSVQAGVRPAIVVQSNAFNACSSTLIVCPLTTKTKKLFPSEFVISPSKKNGLTEKSRFLGSQIMTLDIASVIKKLGTLEPEYYEILCESLKIALDFDDVFES